MTTVVESRINNQYYVSLEIGRRYNNDIYIVQACPCYDDNRCGYPERKATYSIKDKAKAHSTYRRYVKKYCN